MQPETFAVIAPWITVLFAAISPLLAWWGSTRYFSGRFVEWRKSSDEWRDRVDKRLESFDVGSRAALDENIKLRISRLESELDNVREWKHLRAEPKLGMLNAIITRIDRVEKFEPRIDRLERHDNLRRQQPP